MKILFIGDIVGRIGRRTVTKLLPKLRRENKIDFVIANIENAAHGYGATENVLKELLDSGIDFFSSGDHIFKNKKTAILFEKFPLIRPANYPPKAPGEGYKIIDKKGQKLMIVNLIGRTFMKANYDCPFRKLDEILANNNLRDLKKFAIIVDIHAETTSEKACLKHYADGRISALLGTHTHIQTADAEITKQGCAFITDVGMVGFKNGSLGTDTEGLIRSYLSQIKEPHVIPEKGEAILNAVIIEINKNNHKAKKIKPLYLNTKIK